MKRTFPTAFILLAFLSLRVGPVQAKARLVAVFPVRSTAELTGRAMGIAREIVLRLNNVDGYEAHLIPAPTGSPLGVAAAAAGAETYVVGQVTSGDNGLSVTIGSFAAATDKPIAEYHANLTAENTLPETPSISSLLVPDAIPLNGAGSASPVGADGVLLPTGTPVYLTVDAPISSSSASVGDTFAFKVATAIVVDGFVVVAKGAEGEGQVTVAEHSGGNGHPGKLGLQFNWIAGVDGNKIALSDTQRSEDGEAKQGASSTATIASYLILGPLGLFAHNFVHGRDITVDDTKVLKAYVDHSVHVVSQIHDVVPAGFAK